MKGKYTIRIYNNKVSYMNYVILGVQKQSGQK